MRRATEEKLRYDALHDSLTGLANRTLLLERIAYCRRRAQRYPDYHFALLFMDLDRFKVIHDSLGHPIGDQLLVSLAHRLQGLGRATDMVARMEGEHLARIGGDEFVLPLDGVAGPDAVVPVVEFIFLGYPFFNRRQQLHSQEIATAIFRCHAEDRIGLRE